MIITGGTNVYPAEIEAALLQHPDVVDVGVFGVPDPDWGESIVAAVAAPSGRRAERRRPQAALIAFCRERLASYKCPRRWEFRDDLPRTEAGKLYKQQLRDEFIDTQGEPSR